MGIGDWGLGIGDWGLGPIPNPQSPIPNPQSPIFVYLFYCKNIINKIYCYYNYKTSIYIFNLKIYFIHKY